ncbi:hypothetical protein SLH46_15540 [Draconibacterium sp. IB214405]|uniref:hypothetical protein n=1 Tax=Draconibacterium sp. IB214405 TaxID=3097352 RepID=UPI002A16A566|nr:hypothetical protein [Draconibacterium sp. IB214405]MDX8340610.1 hypothetical protein [Draconibacterium sp. IB214405]
MKKIIGFSVLAVAMFMFSCSTKSDESIDIPEMSEELTLKSAQIAVAEVQAEAANTECNYEVEFYANAESLLTRWWKMGKLFSWNNNLRYFENKCPDVTIEENVDEYDKTITLNYGDSTALNNGKVLSGQIVINILGQRNSQEYSRLVTYTDFGVDSMLINGTSEVVVDKVDSTFRKFESDMTFVYPDGTTVTRNATRVWQWIAGLETSEIQSDDVFVITGEVTGLIVWPDGTEETYSKVISTPLKRMARCRYVVEGEVEIYVAGELVSTMDYGYSNGEDECDHFALLTTGAGEEVINLVQREYNGKAKQNQDKNKKQNNNKNQNGNG